MPELYFNLLDVSGRLAIPQGHRLEKCWRWIPLLCCTKNTARGTRVELEWSEAQASLPPAQAVRELILVPLLRACKTPFVLLHASAVELKGRAHVFCGPSQHGKSTCTLALLAHGARYLSDDLTLISREPLQVHPLMQGPIKIHSSAHLALENYLARLELPTLEALCLGRGAKPHWVERFPLGTEAPMTPRGRLRATHPTGLGHVLLLEDNSSLLEALARQAAPLGAHHGAKPSTQFLLELGRFCSALPRVDPATFSRRNLLQELPE